MTIEDLAYKNIDFLDQQNYSPLLYIVTNYKLLIIKYKTFNGITNYDFINQFMQE